MFTTNRLPARSKSFCVVIDEHDGIVSGYVPALKLELHGESVQDVKNKARAALKSTFEQQMMPLPITTISFVEVEI